MKKEAFFSTGSGAGIFTFLTVLLFSGYGLASMVGNPPGFPEGGKISFGAEYWHIDSRDVFEFDDMLDDELESEAYALRISYGITDFLTVDFRAGQADFTLMPGETEYDKGPFWGLGLRAIIYESPGGLKVMAGVQYNDYDPDNTVDKTIEFEAELDDLSVSLDISKKFADRFTVYGGVQHSDLTLKYFHAGDFGQREGGYRQDQELGVYGGLDVEVLNGLSFFAEGQFANQEAYILGLAYKLTLGETAPPEEPPAAPPLGEILSGRIHIGAEASRFTDKAMTEAGGFVPEFSAYHMSSDRVFVNAYYDVVDRVAVFGKLGLADLETHSSEGETTEFDSEFAWAVGVRGKLLEIENGLVISGELSYLRFEPKDEATVSTPKKAASTGGDLSIEWSEFNIAFDVSKHIENSRLFAGISYTGVSADQDRTFEDGTVVSSEFEAEDDLGLFVGAAHSFTEKFSVMFKADFINVRGYTFGGSFSF